MKFGFSSVLLAAALPLAAGLASCGDHDEMPGEVACKLKPTETFHERIEPLIVEGRPTTCNQCHLSGVDLSAFARETPCKTWACLLDQGLVNVKAPAESTILTWIERASPDSDLITPQVIRAEHDAFQEWIEANAACPTACEGVTCGATKAGPNCPSPDESPPGVDMGEDLRGCADVDLEQAFYDDVYAWRGRCISCHSDLFPDGDKEAPRWISTAGNCETGSAVTFKQALTLGIMNFADPEKSLILLKPLDKDGGGVAHGGGQKYADTTDDGYQSMMRFIRHYKECKKL